MIFKVTNVSSDTNLNTTPETRNFRIFMQEVLPSPEVPLSPVMATISNFTLMCTEGESAAYPIGGMVNVLITPAQNHS